MPDALNPFRNHAPGRQYQGVNASRWKYLAPLIAAIVCLDCTTKEIAVATLQPPHVPHPVLGDFIRFTLAFNTGSAMSLMSGPQLRWPLAALATVALVVLAVLMSRTRESDRWRLAALALVTAGALGNLIDRVRSDRGVVDFVDIGVGAWRFWVFNVADVAVSVGAVLIALQSLRVPASTESPLPRG